MDESVEIKSLLTILTNLIEKTLNECTKSGMIKEEEIEQLQESFQREGLTPEQIENDCSEELKNLCLYEYNEVIQGSNRLNGKGYSSYKIKENMKIFLKERLTKFATLISLKKSLKPPSLEKSFLETLREISQ
jgi:hypothetical protein